MKLLGATHGASEMVVLHAVVDAIGPPLSVEGNELRHECVLLYNCPLVLEIAGQLLFVVVDGSNERLRDAFITKMMAADQATKKLAFVGTKDR